MKYLFAATLCLPVVVQASELDTKTARALLKLAPSATPVRQGFQANNDVRSVALALARVGAYETAKAQASRITSAYDGGSNSREATLDEVNQITVRRKIRYGKRDEARTIAKLIKAPSHRADTLALLANDAIERGEMDEAHGYLVDIAKLDGHKYANDENLAVLFAKTNDIAAAKRIFSRRKDILEKANIWNVNVRNRQWDELCAAMIRAGFVTEAVELSAQKTRVRSFTYRELSRRQKFDDTMILLESEHNDNSLAKSSFLALSAIMFFDKARSQEAREAAIKAEELCLNEVAEKDKQELTISIYVALNAVGEEKRADDFLRDPRLKLELNEQTLVKLASILYRPYLQMWADHGYEFVPSLSQVQLKESRSKLQQLIPEFSQKPEDADSFLGAALMLVSIHLKSGDKQGAEEVLMWAEKFSPTLAAEKSEISSQGRAQKCLEMARLWRETGDITQANAWLRKYWNIPLLQFEQQQIRAPYMVSKGFVTQGRAKFRVSDLKLPTAMAATWGSCEASPDAIKNARVDFPTWSVVMPAKERLIALTAFTKTLEKQTHKPYEENKLRNFGSGDI
jgi:hypothetical protein